MRTPYFAHPNAFTVTLAGDVDVARSDELHAVVDRFERSGCSCVHLDVRSVDFVDSTGLSTIVGLRQVAAQRGGTVSLVGPKPQFERVLRISGLEPLVEILPFESAEQTP